MANVTVSSAVDTMLQSASNSAIRTNIGALDTGFSGALTGDIEFQDGEILFNEGFSVEGGDVEFTDSGQSLIMGGNNITGGGEITASTITAQGMLAAEADAEFQDSVEFQASVEFQDDVTVSNGSIELQDGGLELSGGGDIEFTDSGSNSIIGANSINAVSVEGSSFIKVSPITTTARNLLSASNGMIIYNSTDNKFQAYENGGWANLI
jgi:hypothetical protein